MSKKILVKNIYFTHKRVRFGGSDYKNNFEIVMRGTCFLVPYDEIINKKKSYKIDEINLGRVLKVLEEAIKSIKSSGIDETISKMPGEKTEEDEE